MQVVSYGFASELLDFLVVGQQFVQFKHVLAAHQIYMRLVPVEHMRFVLKLNGIPEQRFLQLLSLLLQQSGFDAFHLLLNECLLLLCHIHVLFGSVSIEFIEFLNE